MIRRHWSVFGPSLVVAAGIIVATLVAVLAAESGWLVMAGPLLLGLAVVSADVLGSRLKGEPSGPSWAALLLGGTFLLAGVIVALREPGLVKTLIPTIGSSAWVILFLSRPDGRRKACRVSNPNK